MKNKTQIFFIHGGMTFKNQKDYLHFLKTRWVRLEKKNYWSLDYLDKHLGRNFEIIRPVMPLKENAKYNDWKIWFDRFIPYMRRGVILVGVSLGGIFLAKYLSEHKFPKKILSTYLVCPPFDDTLGGPLVKIKEDLAGGFKLKSNISLLEKNSKNLILMFSKDDDVVPISHAEKYKKKLKNPKIIIYKSKNGHFRISKFPEIVKMIKSDVKNKNL